MLNRSPLIFTITACLAGLAAGQQCEWQAFSAPPGGDGFNLLYDIDGVAADEVWAVWRYGTSDFFYGTHALHFDGTGWIQHPTPTPTQLRGWNDLWGVVTLASDDAIAVGSYNPDSGATQSLAIRWDGSEWSRIDSPIIEGGSFYFGIDQVGDEMWAVGGRRWGEDPPAAGAIAMATRWTGSGWVEEFVPPLAALGGRSHNDLYAVDGASPDDIWGVGVAQQTGPTDPFGPRTYLVHWNGSEWSLFEQDFGHRSFSAFTDVVALAADDVWVVGYTLVDGESTEPLIVHYDGSSWSQYPLPLHPEGPCELRAVTARSSDEIYAMGTWAESNGSPRDFILRYDGNDWTQMNSATINGEDQWYRGATTLPGGDVWTVGQFFDHGLGATIGHTERLSCDPGCPADFDGDGSVNTLDVLAFLNAWSAGDPRGDFNGDGAVNTLDVLSFLNAWSAGC